MKEKYIYSGFSTFYDVLKQVETVFNQFVIYSSATARGQLVMIKFKEQ